ncbi:MAG: hypothetical protein JSV23_10190 [Promethearchaeota archaeon]|nr:MAG: hypothetical protein JSV23_10190 [Candidatus Lokiarchaeota archaeon]
MTTAMKRTPNIINTLYSGIRGAEGWLFITITLSVPMCPNSSRIFYQLYGRNQERDFLFIFKFIFLKIENSAFLSILEKEFKLRYNIFTNQIQFNNKIRSKRIEINRDYWIGRKSRKTFRKRGNFKH